MRCSDRDLCSAFQRPCPHAPTASSASAKLQNSPPHSQAKPELCLCEDTGSSPRADTCLVTATLRTMTRAFVKASPPRLDVAPGLVRDAGREGTTDHGSEAAIRGLGRVKVKSGFTPQGT